jgi:hypothetical protein
VSWGKVAFLGLVIAVALSGYAVGAGSGGSDEVVLCAAKKGGDLSLAKKGKCGKGTKKLSIAKARPQGAQGPAGAPGGPGATGAPGTTTTLSTEPAHLVAAGLRECTSAPGAFCDNVPGGACFGWTNFQEGFAPAAYRKDSAGFVHLSGTVIDGGAGGGVGCGPPPPIFYLPPGFRITGGTQRFGAWSCAGGGSGYINYVDVKADGGVYAGDNSCASLDGITFHADA